MGEVFLLPRSRYMTITLIYTKRVFTLTALYRGISEIQWWFWTWNIFKTSSGKKYFFHWHTLSFVLYGFSEVDQMQAKILCSNTALQTCFTWHSFLAVVFLMNYKWTSSYPFNSYLNQLVPQQYRSSIYPFSLMASVPQVEYPSAQSTDFLFWSFTLAYQE